VKKYEATNKMRPVILSIQALMLVFVLSAASFGQDSKLNIIYTGSLQGQLEPCGCSPMSDFGGIARVAGYISAHEDELSPYVLIDAGNFSGKDTPQGKLKTEAMANFLGSMKYDAVGFSEKEQAFQGDFSTSTLKGYNVPFVSALPGHRQSVELSKNTFDINVSSVPEDIKKGKVNILITNLPVSDASSLKGWDVVITSSGEETEEPVVIDKMIIVAGYPKGKKIGILTLKHDKNGKLDYIHRWQPTGNDIIETEIARTILEDYNSKVSMLLKEEDKPPPGTTYTGVAECVACHQPFMDQWVDTRHATAFASLEEVGKASDPECIVCHVVGFGEKGGFYTIKSTPELANVQCESCHGIGRKHLSDYSLMSPVTEATCLKCHTEENSPEFDYPLYLEKIKH
jgi:hypothetical protein